MVYKHLKRHSLLAVLMINAVAAHATVDLSGFASAGYTVSDTDAAFISGADVISESASFGADNTVAVQISADVNKQIRTAAQLLAKGTVDSYSVAAQWAYIDYTFSNRVSARMGRLNFPATLFSEYQEVGFSYPWVRPPIEAYTLLPISTYSGVDVVYSIDGEGVSWLIQPFIGSAPGIQTSGGALDVELAYGVTLTGLLDSGKFSFIVAQGEGVDINFISGGTNINSNVDAMFMSAGIEYEQNNLLLIAELVSKDVRNNPEGDIRTVSDMMAYYITFGYRIGEFLPHFTYADTHSDYKSTFVPAGTALPGPPPQGIPAQYWVAPMDMVTPSNAELLLQKSYTLGLRYDYNSQTAFKMDYQRIIPDDDSWGVFFSDPGSEVNILSLVVDVVF